MRLRRRVRVLRDERYADDWKELHLLPTAPRRVIDAAWRALSQEHHPDAGGDPEAQARLNAAHARLVGLVSEREEA